MPAPNETAKKGTSGRDQEVPGGIHANQTPAQLPSRTFPAAPMLSSPCVWWGQQHLEGTTTFGEDNNRSTLTDFVLFRFFKMLEICGKGVMD
uniref:Uncharacterized protein n=1 Tax=Caenorhabditis japonica TaxID=281687 RepID=A0A8R1IBX8_CAEJA